MSKGCIVYSFGSNGDYQYEGDFLKKTSCEVLPLTDNEFRAGKNVVSNCPKNFLGIGREVRILRTIMKDLKHQRIDVLKVDIEGAEYDVFDELFSSGFLDVDQILVEVHLQQLNTAGSVVQTPSKLRMQLDRFFEVLEKAGFRLFHKEINILWSRPMYSNMGIEYAFIRVS